jgi:hypothetical protein
MLLCVLNSERIVKNGDCENGKKMDSEIWRADRTRIILA